LLLSQEIVMQEVQFKNGDKIRELFHEQTFAEVMTKMDERVKDLSQEHEIVGLTRKVWDSDRTRKNREKRQRRHERGK
jgi:hypothetical protein